MDFPNVFIGAGEEFCTHDNHVNAPLLRRSFDLNKPVCEIKKASLLVSGLGFFDLSVNGRQVSKLFAPYISNPDDMVYYDQIDVKKELKDGENVLGLILGNGMQNAFGGYIWDFEKAAWRGSPRAALKLEIEFNDDSKQEVCSCEGFTTSPSPITFDDLRSGEYYDARLEQPGWDKPGFDASAWTNAKKLTPPRGEKRICEADPIQIMGERKPVEITKYKNGYLYDFGINDTGFCRLTICGKEGQQVTMIHGEFMHENGDLTRHDHFQPEGYTQTDKYTCKGSGTETYIPRFTYQGFRYVIVEGIEEEQAKPELLTYLIVHSKLDERGSFNCSNEVVNKIQEITRRSTLSNFHYFPTDCPHREKNGWTGDAAVSVEHTLLNLAPEKSYREWLHNIRKSQNEAGTIPGIIPTGGWGFAWGNGPAWDCALTLLPYFTYKYRGDKLILEENATAIFRYLNYISKNRDEKSLVELGLGDWCPPSKDSHEHTSPVIFTDTIICMDVCEKAAFIFGEIGWHHEQAYATRLGEELKWAIRKHLINPMTLVVEGNCQTSQAMAIYYNMFKEDEKETAEKILLELIHEKNDHIDTGILGARVIFHVLSAMGESDLAYKMIARPEYPSWGNWVVRGATTLWENFNEDEYKVYSRNHHFFGDVSNWFIQCISGIRYGLGKVEIRPSFISELDFAEGFHIAPEGKIYVKWVKEGSEIKLNVEIPEGLEGEIILPNGWSFEDSEVCKTAKTGEFAVVK